MIYDVIVVGSGPGGAVAASTLAGAGKSVLLADRQSFPRDKVCGDGLPIHVTVMLREMGIDLRRVGLEYQQITSLSITGPSGKTLTTHENKSISDIFSMTSRRVSFDNVLHEHALKSGAHFEMMHIHKPLLNGDQVIGVVERKGKMLIEHEAKIVIAADGAASAIARNLHGRVSSPETTAIAVRAYAQLKKPMPPCVYFYFQRSLLPGYAWIFPIANGRANVGIYLHNHTYHRQKQSLEERLTAFVESLQREYPCEIEAPTVQTWPLPLWTAPHSRIDKGVLFVGDAGQFINAITGGGIYPAMLTGRAAARRAIDLLDGSQNSPDYDTAWQSEVGHSLRRARLAQRYIISSRWLFNGLLAFSSIPKLKSRALRALSGEHY